MLLKHLCAGPVEVGAAFAVAWLLSVAPARAWEQPAGAIAESPHYNDVLREKVDLNPLVVEAQDGSLIHAALAATLPDASLAMRSEPATQDGRQWGTRFSADWRVAVGRDVTTGPVAQYAVERQPLNCLNCALSDTTSQTQVAAVGWRLDTRLGAVSPWAQISYNHQLGGNQPDSTASGPADARRVDVSVGTTVPLSGRLDAFAALTQTGALNSGEQFMYSLGVSTSF